MISLIVTNIILSSAAAFFVWFVYRAAKTGKLRWSKASGGEEDSSVISREEHPRVFWIYWAITCLIAAFFVFGAGKFLFYLFLAL